MLCICIYIFKIRYMISYSGYLGLDLDLGMDVDLGVGLDLGINKSPSQ